MAAPLENSCRFQIMSDLHLETHPSYDYDFLQTAPYLALLGDIGHVANPGLFKFLRNQLGRYRVVFFLLGNHEPYHLSVKSAKEKVAKFSLAVEKLHIKGALGKFVFLDQTRYDLNDSVTVLGCTLYSRVSTEQAAAVQSRLVDFRDILHWDIGEHVDAHLADLEWLNAQVSNLSGTGRKIVIFTHHSPSVDPRATRPRHRNSEVSSGFVTDLSSEVCWLDSIVSLWAFGHTHFNCHFEDDRGKRVVANQKGYFMFPQNDFVPERVFEIDATEDSQ